MRPMTHTTLIKRTTLPYLGWSSRLFTLVMTDFINQIKILLINKYIINHVSEYVRPICLPTTAAELSKDYTSKNVYVAGWGKTENRSESNIKLKLMVTIIL